MKRSALLIVITALFALTITNCNSEEYDQVSIDVSDAGQAIEKYIYGQFIEHLGKCSYGGIWAEMVEEIYNSVFLTECPQVLLPGQ